MSSILPELTLANDIDPYSVCSDIDVVKDYINDELNESFEVQVFSDSH